MLIPHMITSTIPAVASREKNVIHIVWLMLVYFLFQIYPCVCASSVVSIQMIRGDGTPYLWQFSVSTAFEHNVQVPFMA